MKRTLIATILVLVASGVAIGAPPPDDMVKTLSDTIRKKCPEAKIEVTKDAFVAKHGTMTFALHSIDKSGRLSPQTHEEEGPKVKGFILKISLQDGKYGGQADLPATLPGPYYSTFVDARATDGGKKHCQVHFSCGSGLDPELKKSILEAIPKTPTQPTRGGPGAGDAKKNPGTLTSLIDQSKLEKPRAALAKANAALMNAKDLFDAGKINAAEYNKALLDQDLAEAELSRDTAAIWQAQLQIAQKGNGKASPQSMPEAADGALAMEAWMFDTLAHSIRAKYPEAKIESSHGWFNAKHDTLAFSLHNITQTGEIEPWTYEEEGPNFKGFVLDISRAEGKCEGEAALPQVLQGPYFPTFIDAPATDRGKNHYQVRFSYGGGLDPELKKVIMDTRSMVLRADTAAFAPTSEWSKPSNGLKIRVSSPTSFTRDSTGLARFEVTCTVMNVGKTPAGVSHLARVGLVDKKGATHMCQRGEDVEDLVPARPNIPPGQTTSFKQDGHIKIDAGSYRLFVVWNDDGKHLTSPAVEVTVK